MKKIGIIGAGIAGLTCAWRLSQAGMKAIVFEKDLGVGGRTLYSGAISGGKFNQRLNRLIKEFELEELAIPLRKKEIGFLTKEGQLIDVEELQKQMKKQFSFSEGLRMWRLFSWINSFNFDIAKPDPKVYELREVSFEEFLKKYPPKIAQLLKEIACFFGETEDFNPKVMSAEYGLSIVRLANELQSGEAFTFEENNILTLCNVLVKKIEEKGGQILTSSEVNKVEKEEDRFKIYYQEKEEKKITEVERVVLATPLDTTREIFPQLNLETDIYYFNLDALFVKGKFKYPQIKVIKGNPGNPGNIAIAYNTIPYYQVIHSLSGQKVNLEVLYEEWEVMDQKEMKTFPVIGSKAKVPNLKTNIEGAYLAGDFYYHTFLEVAVATGEMAAEMIK